MGAAGLTCSSLEMADKGGTGVELNLNNVPAREENMTPYELMLSESQERMLMVIKPEKEEEARAIFRKWEIDFAVIGKITDTERLVLTFDGETVADIPVTPLSDQAPIYERPYVSAKNNITELPTISSDIAPNDALKELLATPDLASKRWIWEQYDSQVMNDTVAASGGDAAIVRIHGSNKAVAVSADCTPRYCYANAFEGGKQAVAETWRNITAVGGKPLAITNCLNFGNPEKPEIMGQIVDALEGMSEACKTFEYPIVSGNVSLYNETNGQGIMPTPAIGGVGLIDDISKTTRNCFANEGDTILVIGETKGHLGASLFLREIEGNESGPAPTVDLSLEKRHGDFVRELITGGKVTACHDIADGGLYVAIAEMTFANTIGADISVDAETSLLPYLFGEDQGRYVVTCDAQTAQSITEAANSKDIPVETIGKVGGTSLSVNGQTVEISALRTVHESVLPDYMNS
jgi:phosphoribosylformylglycinamidine synthase